MKRIILFFANSLIFLSTVRSTILFFVSLNKFQQVQEKKYLTLLKNNHKTVYFKLLSEKPPLSSWGDYENHIEQIKKGKQNILTKEKVLLLEPTSGTTAPTKFIPYTKSLQKEFNRAIQPWLFGIYAACPRLFFCSQYWSISPEIQNDKTKNNQSITIGFEQDSQYLGKGRSGILNQVMVVPSEIKDCENPENWAYLTAFFLLRDKNLGLISIWHPSFLNILVEKIRTNFSSLISDLEHGYNSSNQLIKVFSGDKRIKPNPKRANQLKILNINDKDVFSKIWPKLKLISCWADIPDETSLKNLKDIFPNVIIQPKGLIATEGIVSIPFGKTFGIPAYRSHFLEFIDLRDESIKKLNQLEIGLIYEVVISTGGGLYRYRMNDVVMVKGLFMNKLPLFQFLYKRDYVSDIRGEKIGLQHVIEIQTELKNRYPEIEFFMIAPVIVDNHAFYTCFIFFKIEVNFPFLNIASFVDENLKQNFHYQYARQIKQLEDIRIFKLDSNPVEAIINYLEINGTKRGDVKFYPLSNLSIWHQKLNGKFIE